MIILFVILFSTVGFAIEGINEEDYLNRVKTSKEENILRNLLEDYYVNSLNIYIDDKLVFRGKHG